MNNQTTMQNLAIPLSIIVAGGLIAGAMYFSGARTAKTAGVKMVNSQELLAGEKEAVPAVTDKDWTRGNPNAKLKIVEYSDPECPFCRIFHTTLQRIMNDYGQSGDVSWTYRHMPLAGLHAKAYDESVAMQCAGMVGGTTAFWAFADELFAKTPSNDGLDHALFASFATKSGIDAAKFDACLKGPDAKKVVDATLDEAGRLGIQGTPASFILLDGQQVTIDGAQPYEAVKKVIETLLKK
jgi:protein-disulfide isomerase